MSERVERKFKGHFIAADSCHWWRVTDVGDYRISSIGDYRPAKIPGITLGNEIGYNRTYETMVFRLGDAIHSCDVEGCEMNGAREVAEWSEIDSDGYKSKAAAGRGHEKMVEKYLAGFTPEAPDARA